MAVTYTDNLHLGMQLDKTDYVNWDAITQNWQKLDRAIGVFTDLMDYTWEQGTSDDYGGFIPESSQARILCQSYFEILSDSRAIKVNGVADKKPLLFLVDFYREDRSFIIELGWTNDFVLIPQGAKYARFVLRYNANLEPILPSELSSCNMIIT